MIPIKKNYDKLIIVYKLSFAQSYGCGKRREKTYLLTTRNKTIFVKDYKIINKSKRVALEMYHRCINFRFDNNS